MANPAVEWTKVLIHPLGLAGYVLFLLFGLLARAKRRDERRWILPVALAAAGAALLSGIGLAYRDVNHSIPSATGLPGSTAAPAPAVQQHNDHIKQTSTGTGSPNVQGVQGDVTITVNQSSGTTAKRPTQEGKTKNPPPNTTP